MAKRYVYLEDFVVGEVIELGSRRRLGRYWRRGRGLGWLRLAGRLQQFDRVALIAFGSGHQPPHPAPKQEHDGKPQRTAPRREDSHWAGPKRTAFDETAEFDAVKPCMHSASPNVRRIASRARRLRPNEPIRPFCGVSPG